MRKNKRGFTLIEAVMVVVIVGILAAVASMYIKETMDLWQFLSFRNEAVAQGRMALIRMEREIRQIKDKSSIYVAEAARLQFDDISAVSIDYRLSGTNLTRNSQILASNVTNFSLCYYDKNNSAVCSPECACTVSAGQLDEIYRIGIEMDISSGDQTKSLKSQVHPRNIN